MLKKLISLESYYARIIFLTFILFGQYLTLFNYVLTLFSMVLIFLGLIKKWDISIVLILGLPFSIAEGATNIYSIKAGPANTLYILIILVFTLNLLFRKINKTHKNVMFFSTLSIMIFVYSIINGNPFKGVDFWIDSIFIFIAILFSILLFDFKKLDFDKLFIPLGFSYYLVKTIIVVTGIGLESTNYTKTIVQYNAMFDPIENFLLIYSILTAFSKKELFKKIYACLNIILFCIASGFLGYVHGGTVVIILCVVFYSCTYNKSFIKYGSLILILSAALYPVISMIENSEESVMTHKFEKVMGLVDFILSDNSSIYDLPRSTQVRMIETGNIFNQPVFYLLFGKGFGGTIEEIKYKYGAYLNKHDYPEEQLKKREFSTMHTYNQILLKHGLLSIIMFALLKFLYFKERRVEFDSALIFILFSYGFTIKPYLMLGFLLYEVSFDKNRKLS